MRHPRSSRTHRHCPRLARSPLMPMFEALGSSRRALRRQSTASSPTLGRHRPRHRRRPPDDRAPRRRHQRTLSRSPEAHITPLIAAARCPPKVVPERHPRQEPRHVSDRATCRVRWRRPSLLALRRCGTHLRRPPPFVASGGRVVPDLGVAASVRLAEMLRHVDLQLDLEDLLRQIHSSPPAPRVLAIRSCLLTALPAPVPPPLGTSADRSPLCRRTAEEPHCAVGSPCLSARLLRGRASVAVFALVSAPAS